jgi:hypothetical protein
MNILLADRRLHRLAGHAPTLRPRLGPIASRTARRERGDPQAAIGRHRPPAPECPDTLRNLALDGATYVRYMFRTAPDSALRLDIVDIYRRFRLVSLARKSIAG